MVCLPPYKPIGSTWIAATDTTLVPFCALNGYVSYHGTLTLEELMRDDPAESYHQEQEANMEGMAW